MSGIKHRRESQGPGSRNPAEARDLYARGVEAGELALGPEGLEELTLPD